MPQRFQFGPDFPVVVDFAVKRDGGIAVFRNERLIAARKVDDLQAHGAEGSAAAFKDPLLVRSPMEQSFRDTACESPVGESI